MEIGGLIKVRQQTSEFCLGWQLFITVNIVQLGNLENEEKSCFRTHKSQRLLNLFGT